MVCINGESGFGVPAISTVVLCLCSCYPRAQFTWSCTGLHQNGAVLLHLSGWAGHDVTISDGQNCPISRPYILIDVSASVLYYNSAIDTHTIICWHIMMSDTWSCMSCFELQRMTVSWLHDKNDLTCLNAKPMWVGHASSYSSHSKCAAYQAISDTPSRLCWLSLWSDAKSLCSDVNEQSVNCRVQTNCTLVVVVRLIKYGCSNVVIGHAKLRNTAVA